MPIILIISCLFLSISASEVSWEHDLRSHGWSSASIAVLQREGTILVQGNPGIKTPFITSDVMLHAYSLLIIDSLQEAEKYRSIRLKKWLEERWRTLTTVDQTQKDPDNLLPMALRRARVILGVANTLMNPQWHCEWDELRPIITEHVATIHSATAGFLKPSWMPTNPEWQGIDLNRLQARGLHADEDVLARLWQTHAWLAGFEFSGQRREDMAILAILRGACEEQELRRIFRPAFLIAGPPKLPDLVYDCGDPFSAYSADLPPRWQIVSDCVLPDMEWLRSVTTQGFPCQNFSFGRAFAASLGSTQARLGPWFESAPEYGKKLSEIFNPPPRIDKLKFLYRHLAFNPEIPSFEWNPNFARPWETLHGQYLYCLSLLLREWPAQAPELFRQEAWQRKSLRTVLKAWTDETYSLQLFSSKIDIFGGPPSPPAVIVEPHPRFFEALADCAENAKTCFGSLWDTPESQLKDVQQLLYRAEAEDKPQEKSRLLQRACALLDSTFPVFGQILPNSVRSDPCVLRQSVTIVLANEKVKKAPLTVGSFLDTHAEDLQRRWTRFSEDCRNLAMSARRQLAQQELEFTEYGRLCAIKNLYSDDYITKCHIVPLAHRSDGRWQHIATTPSENIIVLYPWHNTFIPAVGTIWGWREFSSPQPISDQTWEQSCSTGKLPPTPTWMALPTMTISAKE